MTNPTTPASGDELPQPAGDIRLPGAFGLACDGYTADQMRAFRAEGIAADRAARQAPVVPAGWKLVPMEPTDAMGEVGERAWLVDEVPVARTWADVCQNVYRAMVAAAPASPLQQAQDGEMEREYEVNLTYDYGVMQVAGASGPNALAEAMRYAHQYVEEGPVEVYEVKRTLVAKLAAIQSDAARSQAEGGKEGAKP